MSKGNSRVRVTAIKREEKRVNIPPEWEKWCSTGRHKGLCKQRAVDKCRKGRVVRGYFSGFRLDPKLPPTDSMYPSVEHLSSREDNEHVAVETRIVNDMKSHLIEEEFWQLIGHLFSVGLAKGKIVSTSGERLKNGWYPEKDFEPAKLAKE